MAGTAERLFDPSFETHPVIIEHASVAIDAVYNSLSLELDLTSDTISILDYYISTVGQVDGSIVYLLSSAMGAYFGELMRRTLGGVWVIPSAEEPMDWELRFTSCPMSIFPVAISAEVLAKETSEEIDASFCVAPSRLHLLEEMLERSVAVTEREYYSFAGRIDAIELSVDFLSHVEKTLAEKKREAPTIFGSENPLTVPCLDLSIMDSPPKQTTRAPRKPAAKAPRKTAATPRKTAATPRKK